MQRMPCPHTEAHWKNRRVGKQDQVQLILQHRRCWSEHGRVCIDQNMEDSEFDVSLRTLAIQWNENCERHSNFFLIKKQKPDKTKTKKERITPKTKTQKNDNHKLSSLDMINSSDDLCITNISGQWKKTGTANIHKATQQWCVKINTNPQRKPGLLPARSPEITQGKNNQHTSSERNTTPAPPQPGWVSLRWNKSVRRI